MKLSHLSFRIKTIAGFTTILLLFIAGLGIGMFGMNKTSTMMGLSSKANQLVKEMFQTRDHEKEYLIHKRATSVEGLNQGISNLQTLIGEIESRMGDKTLSGLTEIDTLVEQYHTEFRQTAENTTKIEKLKAKMRQASGAIFENIDKKIRAPILEAQNMALVTGQAASPVLGEILKVADNLVMNLKDARLYENAFILYDDPQYVKKFDDKMMDWDKTKEDFAYLINTSKEKGLKEAYATIQAQFGIYNSKTFSAVLTLWEANNKISKSMQDKGDKIGTILQQLQQDAEGEVTKAKDFTLKLCTLLLVIGILSGIFLIFFIVRSITKPINHVVAGLKDIAEGEGDLTMRLEVKTRDEVGELARRFNAFVEKIQGMIKDIAGNAETLGSSSIELSAISKQMSTGAGQTSDKSNNVATRSEEMSSNMNSVASAMEQASTNIDMVATSTEEMTATINEIAQNSEKARAITDEAVSEAKGASDSVDELGSAAQEISKVTETITEISEQTNLLALNATIEAARAGDAGKGFAVVANEIKELARQTAEATQDIKKRIEGMQGSTAGTVTKIQQISKIINDVNDIVSTIATAVEEQSVTTKEIATNVAQASTGIGEVTENVVESSTVAADIAKDISEVNQAADEITNSSSQVNLSAEELNKLAEQLKEMVGRFRV